MCDFQGIYVIEYKKMCDFQGVYVNEYKQMCYFQGVYVIEYKRINHYDFKFLLEIRNPNLVEKKVIVRLWLVPTNIIYNNIKYINIYTNIYRCPPIGPAKELDTILPLGSLILDMWSFWGSLLLNYSILG